ncbi:MAG: AI-2E family transporter [Alphaproteobacteria bacterium]|nr:AI-2E family transporter [Alphaproteobacteria bacterium]
MTETQSRATTWLVAALVAGVVLYLLRDVLLPFVAGFAVAYMLDPLVNRLARWRIGRGLASAVAIVLSGAVALGLLLMTVPVLRAQIATFVQRLPTYVERVRGLVEPMVDAVGERLGLAELGDPMRLIGNQASEALGWLGGLLIGLVSGSAAIVNILSLLFITPLVAFYLLRDWPKVTARLNHWLPKTEAAAMRAQLREIDRTLAGFARGQALVCLSLAIFYAVTLTAAGLDFGVLVGLFAGFASFIPFLGAFGGGLLSIGLALIQFPTWGPVLTIATIFVAGQILEGYVLTPKLVGDRVGLHPVWIIFALMVGGTLFGFLGLLLAVPAAAAIGVLVRFAIERYLASPFYRGSARE